MNEEIVSASIRFAVAAVGLAVVCFFMLKKTCLDVYRSDLFGMRDRLFDFMWKNDHNFEMTAYRRLRDEINGFIRFGHQFDLASIVAVSLFSKATEVECGVLAEIEAVENVEIREFFLGIYHEAGRRSYRYLFLVGSHALIVIPLIVLYVVCKNGGRRPSEMPPRIADRMSSLGRDDPAVADLLVGLG